MKMYCWKCGAENKDNTYKCVKCEALLYEVGGKPDPGTPTAQPDRQSPGTQSSEILGGLIPSKNMEAVIAYYLGIFSIIPFLGAVLAIPAFIMGFVGFSKAQKVPTAKGKAHALTGIILGGLSTAAHLVLLSFFL
jgi:hypothetical protein